LPEPPLSAMLLSGQALAGMTPSAAWNFASGKTLGLSGCRGPRPPQLFRRVQRVPGCALSGFEVAQWPPAVLERLRGARRKLGKPRLAQEALARCAAKP